MADFRLFQRVGACYLVAAQLVRWPCPRCYLITTMKIGLIVCILKIWLLHLKNAPLYNNKELIIVREYKSEICLGVAYSYLSSLLRSASLNAFLVRIKLNREESTCQYCIHKGTNWKKNTCHQNVKKKNSNMQELHATSLILQKLVTSILDSCNGM